MFNAPDIESDTRSFWPLQVLPICWWFTPDPTVHVVTAFWVWASPNKKKTQFRIKEMSGLVKLEFLQSLTVQSADEVNIDLLSGLQSQAIYTTTTLQSQTKHTGWNIVKKRLTMLPLWGLSVNSATVSPVLPSYRKNFESEPTLAKWSPDNEYFTSWTNLLCVLIVYKTRSVSKQKKLNSIILTFSYL